MVINQGDSRIDHPTHYGGEGNPYEVIKVIEAWGLGFCLGNALKYIGRSGKKYGENPIDDLKKAAWYINREIRRLQNMTEKVRASN